MSAKRIRCSCGQMISIPDSEEADKVRCPACGAVKRKKRTGRGRPKPPAPSTDPSKPVNLAAQHIAEFYKPEPEPDDDEEDELPFLDATMFLYPFFFPNVVCWIGLSFLTMVTAGLIAGTLVVFAIVATAAIGSIFALSGMVMVCLALTAYILACFVTIIQETACGANRLYSLPGLDWSDILPPLGRTFAALVVTVSLSFFSVYPLRQWFEWDNPILLIALAVLILVLFPIWMLAYLIDHPVMPIVELWTTLVHLARWPGSFLLFLVLSILAAVAMGELFVLFLRFHTVLALFAIGPMSAAWLMYYGYWLGRLARQLMAER